MASDGRKVRFDDAAAPTEGSAASRAGASSAAASSAAPSHAPGTGLAVQNLATLDVSTLTPLTREVISRQATINIGEEMPGLAEGGPSRKQTCAALSRNNWPRRSRQVHGREGDQRC